MNSRCRARWLSAAAFCSFASPALAAPLPSLFQASLPTVVRPSTVVLETSQGLSIESNAQVGSSGDVIVGSGSPSCYVRDGATIGTLYCGGPVSFGRATASGTLVSASSSISLAQGAVTAGTWPSTDLRLRNVELARVTWPASGAAISLEPDKTQTISQGSYGTVSVKSRSKLTLNAGTYYFDSLTLEPNATLAFEDATAPVIIYVKGSVINRATIASKSNGGNVLLVSAGTEVTMDTAFIGTIIAPNSEMTFGGNLGTVYKGTFFARHALVRPFVRINRVTSNVAVGVPIAQSPSGPGHWTPVPGYTQFTCGQTLEGTFSNGSFGEMQYHNPNDPNCPVATRFCDDSGNPVSPPTEAELNRAPGANEACPAIAGSENVDITKLHGTCSSSASCPAGEVCASVCDNASCTATHLSCAPVLQSALGVPAEKQYCDARVFRECPDPGASTGATAQDVTNQFPPQDTPPPSATVTPAERPATNPYLDLKHNDLCSGPVPLKIKDPAANTDNPVTLGNKTWGVFWEPYFKNHTKLGMVKNYDPQRPDTSVGGWLGAEGGIKTGVTVLGGNVEVLAVRVAAQLGCDNEIGADLRLFGDTIATLNTDTGVDYGITSLQKTENRIVTKPEQAQGCKNWFDQRNASMDDLRRGSVAAHAIYNYVRDNGANADLCQKTLLKFGDPDNHFDCDPDNPALAYNLDIPRAWKKEYDDRKKKFLDFNLDKTNFDLNKGFTFEGAMTLFELGKRYSFAAPDQFIPIGPLTLTLAFEAFGAWHLRGSIDFGLRWDGKILDAFHLASYNNPSQINGTFQGGVGPKLEPGVDVGVLAYAGVGIPGVSIGVEGSVTLFGFNMPAKLQVVAARIAEPDTRSVQQSQFAGEEDPNFPSNVTHHWRAALTYSVDADLTALNGEIDLAARIKVLFFKKTFKRKLASLKGIQKTFHLAGGPLWGELDLGLESDPVAYTKVGDLTVADLPTVTNTRALFPLLLTDGPCIIID